MFWPILNRDPSAEALRLHGSQPVGDDCTGRDIAWRFQSLATHLKWLSDFPGI